MAIHYEMQTDDDVLTVVASGFDESLEQTFAYSQSVIQTAVAHGCTRILCDERALEYRLSTIDTFDLARQIIDIAPKLAKVALVCNPMSSSDAQFFENVVVNRGLSVRVFKTLTDAKNWLDI